MPVPIPQVAGVTALDENSGVNAYASGVKNAPDSTLGSVFKGIQTGIKTANAIDSVFDVSGKQAAAAQIKAKERQLEEIKLKNDLISQGITQKKQQMELTRDQQKLDANNIFIDALGSGDDEKILESLQGLAGVSTASELKAATQGALMRVQTPGIRERIQNAVAPIKRQAEQDTLAETRNILAGKNDVFDAARLKGFDDEQPFEIKIEDLPTDGEADLTDPENPNATTSRKRVIINQAGKEDIEIISKDPNAIAEFQDFQQSFDSFLTENRYLPNGAVDPLMNEALVQTKSRYVQGLLRNVNAAKKDFDISARMGLSPEEIAGRRDRLIMEEDLYKLAVEGFANVPSNKISEFEDVVRSNVEQYAASKYALPEPEPVVDKTSTNLQSVQLEKLATKFQLPQQTIKTESTNPRNKAMYDRLIKSGKLKISYEAYIATILQTKKNKSK